VKTLIEGVFADYERHRTAQERYRHAIAEECAQFDRQVRRAFAADTRRPDE
jgi:hypothetical protein